MATTPWSAPTVRALNEVANARFGPSVYYDGQGYEGSLPDFGG